MADLSREGEISFAGERVVESSSESSSVTILAHFRDDIADF